MKDDVLVGLISGFNYDTHPIYDDELSKEIKTDCDGRTYRLRKGANLHYMMTMEFFKNVYGFYSLGETEKPSADLTKASELDGKGYRTLVAVPSLMQQIGAFGSSFSRLKSDEVACDY